MTISVLIPAYNAARTLPATVASVLAQTRRADEVVVIDDGSTDETPEICGRLPQVVRVIRRENGGLAAARNTGLSATTGEWFLSLDADDTLFPNALEHLAGRAAEGDAGVVYGMVLQRRAIETEHRLHSLAYAVGDPPEPAKAQFWWTAISTAGSALVKRSVNDSVGGFDESFRQVEDCEYWLRCGVTTPFRHCGQLVLDKAFSAASLGQQVGSGIWYRIQLQLKFLLWCERRGMDTGFLGVGKAAIFDHAITRIFRGGQWAILEAVLDQASRERVVSLWVMRGKLRLAWLRLTGRVPARPAFCREVYRDWLGAKS